ncbi:MAG: hypothetical protein WCD86_20650, partial [Ktedonobacteraceae bacterium]
ASTMQFSIGEKICYHRTIIEAKKHLSTRSPMLLNMLVVRSTNRRIRAFPWWLCPIGDGGYRLYGTDNSITVAIEGILAHG